MSIPDALKRSLLSGRVIPFVGAGVSMAVKRKDTGLGVFPSWRKLLELAADRLRNEHKPAYANAVQSLVELNKPQEYLTAAKLAREQLGPVWFTFLNEQLNPLRALVDDSSLNLARSIWTLGSCLVITTNYDRVLHWACPQPDNLSSWDIEAPAEQIQTLRQQLEQPTVWHLHGQINNAANLILSPDGYSLLYPGTKGIEVKYKAALTTLRTLLSTQSFLFIGFSLDDFHFVEQLNGVHEIFRGATGPHYVLMREADAHRITGTIPVEVLTFKEFDQPLIDLLQEMGKLAHQSQSSSSIALPALEANASLAPSKSYSPENTVFFVPYLSKGERFLGRKASLEALRAQLTKGSATDIGQAAVLIGLGGLGKSQLAVEYAYLYRDDYPNGVIWLNADQDIDSQLVALAEEAYWVAPEADQKIKLEVARHRLRTYSKTLVILDNLDSLDAIESYLPSPTIHPCILATSRLDQPHFVPVPLYPLDNDFSLRLLVQEGGREPVGEPEWEAAREIAEIFGGLPLALEMAGAYLRHRPVGWQQYLNLLRKNLTAAMPDRLFTTSVTKHEADLYSTLRISEETIASEPLLRNILDLLTWSGTAPMRDSLLCALLNIEDHVKITGAIGLGTAMCILQRSADGGHTIHRLVREIRQRHSPLSDQIAWVAMVCDRMADWFDNELDRAGTLGDRQADTEHLRAWLTHASAYEPRHAARLKLLSAIAMAENAQYIDALTVIEDAHSSLALESNDPVLEGKILCARGHIQAELGHYEDALQNYKKALTIWRESFGGLHKYMSRTLVGIAACYYRLSKHSISLRFAKESLEHSSAVSQGAELIVMSANYLALRDFKNALEYAKKALAHNKAFFGEHHIKTATTINNLGSVYNEIGDYKNALEHYSKALEINQRVYPHHPDTALNISNVGTAYHQLGQHENARIYLEKGLAMEKEFFDDKHPTIIRIVANLAAVLTTLGKRREAHHLLNQYLRDLPKNHPFYLMMKSQMRQLLANPLQAGFRQPSSKKGRRRPKKSK